MTIPDDIIEAATAAAYEALDERYRRVHQLSGFRETAIPDVRAAISAALPVAIGALGRKLLDTTADEVAGIAAETVIGAVAGERERIRAAVTAMRDNARHLAGSAPEIGPGARDEALTAVLDLLGGAS